jgi:hypothetical protein
LSMHLEGGGGEQQCSDPTHPCSPIGHSTCQVFPAHLSKIQPCAQPV